MPPVSWPDDIIDGITVSHRCVRGDSVDLHVAIAGEGTPVLLLHGFPEHWRSWRKQVRPLVTAGFSVWMPDLRGYNWSDAPRRRAAYRLRHLVADVVALVRATGAARVHICGHDWGGVIAWTFAGRHPELLNRLVICNAPHPRLYLEQVRRPPQLLRSWYVLFFQLPWLPERALSAHDFQAIRQMFTRTPASPGAFTAEDIDAIVQALSRPGALTAAVDYYRANRHADDVRRARSTRIDADTLVLWGERDPALSIRLLEGIARVAPNAQVRRYPDAGHWIQNERPDEVNGALLAFLKGQR